MVWFVTTAPVMTHRQIYCNQRGSGWMPFACNIQTNRQKHLPIYQLQTHFIRQTTWFSANGLSRQLQQRPTNKSIAISVVAVVTMETEQRGLQLSSFILFWTSSSGSQEGQESMCACVKMERRSENAELGKDRSTLRENLQRIIIVQLFYHTSSSGYMLK